MINNHHSLILIKPIELYIELNKILSSKQHPYKTVENIIKENSSKLKADKTYGLIKLSFRRIWTEKILKTLKNYTKISLNKLSNMLDIESNIILTLCKSSVTVHIYLLRKIKFKLDMMRYRMF